MKRFKKILLVCDRESEHDELLARAVSLAKSNGARITLIDPVSSEPGELSAIFAALPGAHGQEVGQELLNFHRARLSAIGATVTAQGVEVRTLVPQGVVFLEIIREVLRSGHDLVMKGAEGDRAGWPQLFGSTDLHLLRKCPCPVWIMKKGMAPGYARVLAAVDPDPVDEEKSALDRLILDLATSLSKMDDSELHVVHAWRLVGEDSFRYSAFLRASEAEIERLLEEEEGRHRSRLDTVLEGYPIADRGKRVHLLKGEAGSLIPELARNTRGDLIVMGTVGRTGISGFFIGNTAEAILGQVNCSVLAVKPPGFQTPVCLEG